MFLKTSNIFSDSRKSNTLSIIGEGIELSGEINTEGNIHIDGSMSGVIRANEVVIGPNGNFDGEIIADMPPKKALADKKVQEFVIGKEHHKQKK